MEFAFFRHQVPLTHTYGLAFGPLQSVDVFLVRVHDGSYTGWGEATPLAGYGSETVDSIDTALRAALRLIVEGQDPMHVAGRLANDSPMASSALATAIETCSDPRFRDMATSISAPIAASVACDGETPEAAARFVRRKVLEGWTVFKIKIGWRGIESDIDRIRAVAATLPAGCTIRIDANQSLEWDAAVTLCRKLGDLPVEHLEQPFRAGDWDRAGRLARQSEIPILLDESIWTTEDLAHAAAAGIRAVKLKLCKHPGLAACLDMIALAKRLGIRLIFGNGVQCALGCHLEARVYDVAGISTPSESNGFSRIAHPCLSSAMSFDRGCILDGSVTPMRTLDRPVATASPAAIA